MEFREGMSGRTIKLVAAGAAVVAGPSVASAESSYPSLEIMTEGGLTLSDYSQAIGKVGGGPLTFDEDIGGYQYRYELQDFASRVTVGLVPGSPLTMSYTNGIIQ